MITPKPKIVEPIYEYMNLVAVESIENNSVTKIYKKDSFTSITAKEIGISLYNGDCTVINLTEPLKVGNIIWASTDENSTVESELEKFEKLEKFEVKPLPKVFPLPQIPMPLYAGAKVIAVTNCIPSSNITVYNNKTRDPLGKGVSMPYMPNNPAPISIIELYRTLIRNEDIGVSYEINNRYSEPNVTNKLELPSSSLEYGEKLEKPVINPVYECQDAVGIGNFVPGDLCNLKIDNNLMHIYLPYENNTIFTGKKFMPGIGLQASQSNGQMKESDFTDLVKVLEIQSNDIPKVDINGENNPIIYEGDKSIIVGNIINSAKIEVSIDANIINVYNYISDKKNIQFGTPLMKDQNIKVRQGLCENIWGDYTVVKVKEVPSTISTPEIVESVYEFTQDIQINGYQKGAGVTIYAYDEDSQSFKDISVPRVQRSDCITVYEPLKVDQKIKAEQFFIGTQIKAESKVVTVKPIDLFSLSKVEATEATIREKWNKYKPLFSGNQYIENPVSNGPSYYPGKLAQGFLQDGLNMANFIRVLGGFLDDLILDNSLNEMCQYTAILLNSINQLTHNPTKPNDMSDEFYNLALSGAQSSNLGYGYSNLSDSIQNGYIRDEDKENISKVGHRRWLLNPELKKIGFGFAGKYTAMNVHDTSGPKMNVDFIAWPNSIFPLEFFSAEDPWSVIINPEKYNIPNLSQVKVIITRLPDGKRWILDKSNNNVSDTGGYFNINTESFGINNCIIFRTYGISEFKNGDTFTVNILGIKNIDNKYSLISYGVKFFNL